MAATVRRFQDLISGTITDNPLLVGGTTLNSAVLASLIVIADPNFIALTLDPERVGGAPEIVWVTAHTSGATSATILRAQEGTVAREHLSGTKVIVAMTSDAIEGLEAATAAAQTGANDHSARHATGGADHIGAEIGGYVEIGGADEKVVDGEPTSIFANGATVTFTKPASWASYKIMAWGTVMMNCLIGNTELEARIVIGTNGTAMVIQSSDLGGATISARHQQTGLTADTVVTIQYRETAGDSRKDSSIVNFLAIRTS